MKLNDASQRVLEAFLAKWKAEEDLREAVTRLGRVLSRPILRPTWRRI
jgi:hypothetical protein